MRHVFLTLLLLSGLAISTPVVAQNMGSTENSLSAGERIAILERWYVSMHYDMLADEIDWRHAPGFFGGERLTSRAQVEEDLGPFYLEVFDDIRVEIEKIEASEQSVFSFGTYVLTPRNSAREHRAPFLHVWTVGPDGKLTGLRQYADTLLISQALSDGRVLAAE